MSKKKRDLMLEAELEEKVLDIPENEIWTYQIEGLQAPRIVDKRVKISTKIGIIVVLVVSITLSIFFSLRAVSNDEFDFKQIDGGYMLSKYSNPGNVKEVTIDFADGDKSKPVTEIREYAFNCDEKIVTINIGKDVTKIDGKSFYSCWNLEAVFVDDDNEYYCDIDGVLYDKALTEVIYYPSAHNIYLTKEAGYSVDFPENGSITNDDFCKAVKVIDRLVKTSESGGDITAAAKGDDAALLEKFSKLTGVTEYEKFIRDYNQKVGLYVLPATVTKIGKLSFAYSDITEIYIPDCVKSIETLGFFKAEKLREIYSYPKGAEFSDGIPQGAYRSLPDGLEIIGSDAFTYDREMTYMFVPKSVTQIGHHAFYNMAYKSGDNIEGVAAVNVEASEDDFRQNTKTGESWLPKIDSGLFEKNVDVIYSAERE